MLRILIATALSPSLPLFLSVSALTTAPKDPLPISTPSVKSPMQASEPQRGPKPRHSELWERTISRLWELARDKEGSLPAEAEAEAAGGGMSVGAGGAGVSRGKPMLAR